jgi:hypothetical protein
MNANYKPVNVTASLLATGLVLTLGTDTVTAASCAPDNGGLTLPAGMCATVFADNLGQAPQRRDGLADDTVHSEPVSSIISQVYLDSAGRRKMACRCRGKRFSSGA